MMRVLSYFLTIIIVTFGFVNVWAQNPRGDAPEELHDQGFRGLSQSGKLFTVRVQPKENDLLLFVAGKEAAKVDLETFTVQASWIQGKKKTELKVVPTADFFHLGQKQEGPMELEIEIKPREKKKKSEKFKVHLP